MTVSISMPVELYDGIQKHLFPKGDRREQGGFMFCRFDENTRKFQVFEWRPLAGSDYAFQERDYLELSDKTRASLIKSAHDLQASLIEIHCHPGQHEVAFSLADWIGFKEFVPHIRWRLGKRPYAALVFGHSCVDGFAWIGESKLPVSIDGIDIGDAFVKITGNSFKALERGLYGQI